MRKNALSKQRIVEAAIEILDNEGESALTFRALATRLATGAGAIYWHVADKNELLSATTEHVVVPAITHSASEPGDAIRAIALGIFDTMDAHPWVGAHLSRAPSQTAILAIIERLGAQLLELEVPEKHLFSAGSALGNYILGVAGQNAANARLLPAGTDRVDFLTAVANEWSQLDADQYPFVRRVARQLAEHDDREQFLAGVDLILDGIANLPR